jgi:hypothetical protein
MDVKILSSLLFSTNVIGNFYLENYIYAMFFLLLLITSCIHHYTNTDESFIIDQIALYAVILYGGYFFMHKKDYSLLVYSIIIISFLACAFLYFGGKMTDHLCFHPDKNCADNFHILMHICASLGHHFIVFG